MNIQSPVPRIWLEAPENGLNVLVCGVCVYSSASGKAKASSSDKLFQGMKYGAANNTGTQHYPLSYSTVLSIVGHLSAKTAKSAKSDRFFIQRKTAKFF